MKLVKDTDAKVLKANKVSDQEAEEAVKTILTWMGEDSKREGLLETPKRVIKAFVSVSFTNFMTSVYTVNP